MLKPTTEALSHLLQLSLQKYRSYDGKLMSDHLRRKSSLLNYDVSARAASHTVSEAAVGSSRGGLVNSTQILGKLVGFLLLRFLLRRFANVRSQHMHRMCLPYIHFSVRDSNIYFGVR
uniref:Uncharacterized protein n=1 Tax=Steinernema glaseri TaxID=37863 RepID=A0A1I7YZ61_9BILA